MGTEKYCQWWSYLDSNYYGSEVGKGNKDKIKNCVVPLCMKFTINDSSGDGLGRRSYYKEYYGGELILQNEGGRSFDTEESQFGCAYNSSATPFCHSTNHTHTGINYDTKYRTIYLIPLCWNFSYNQISSLALDLKGLIKKAKMYCVYIGTMLYQSSSFFFGHLNC